jgi:hypothetical protein
VAIILTAHDHRVLADVARFRVLTRPQLTRLGHFRSKTRADAILLRLSRFGYLACRTQPALAGAPSGRCTTLDHAAHALLGLPVPHAQQMRHSSYPFLAHRQAVTDLVIGFATAPRVSCGALDG